MLDKGPSAGDACLKVGLLQVFTWRPSVPWQGPHSALISSQVTSRSPVPSEPGAQGPKSTQLTLQSHSSESTRGSLGSQRSPYSSPLSLSLMPNLAHLHGCSHSCDALPCFSPGSITPWLSATPSPGSSQATHPKAMPTPPTCSPAPVPRSWLARARSLVCLSVSQLPPWRKASSRQGLVPLSSSLAYGAASDSSNISILLSFLMRRACQSNSWAVRNITL